MTSSLDQPVRQFLDEVAARTPAPGGGGAAAMAGAMAAGLVAMAARFSAVQVPGAEALAARADELRRRAAGLVDVDAAAYGNVLDAFALPRDDGTGERERRVREALERAAAVPAELTGIAAEVAGMATRLACAGNPNLRGDSIAGAVLAEASARCAAALVDINVNLGKLGDDLSVRAARNARAAQAAAREAIAELAG